MIHQYRIIILTFLLSLGMVFLSGCKQEKSSGRPSKPNIIFIMADDLGIGDLGCYGQTKFSTDNIDYLAENGVQFTQHYAGSTVCAPSRSVLMTGLHTGHTPIRANALIPLPDSALTIAELLHTAGYTNGIFGKWGLGLLREGIPDEGYPTRQGFDRFFGYDHQGLAHRYYPEALRDDETVFPLSDNIGEDREIYAPDLIHEKALEFIDNNRDKPFFLYYATIIPHAELIAPKDSIMRRFENRFEEIPYKGEDYSSDFKPFGYVSQEQPHATFAAMVTRLDIYVGQILEKLREHGLEEHTIIMFTSDNGTHKEGGHDPGFFNSSGGLRGFKRDLFEGGIRTPFIVYWPEKMEEGRLSDHVSAFQDVMPTFADVAGVSLPVETDGVSFLPTLLDSGQQKNHDYLYWEFNKQGGKQAIRKADFKAVRLNVSQEQASPIMLFDLHKDPFETIDVSGQHPEIVEEMTELMKSARTYNPDFVLFPENMILK